MSKGRERNLIIVIIKHCQKIEEKVSNITRDQFKDNEDLIQIVCFNILQIGELAKNFDQDFINRYNKVPWKQIKGMRDKVAHGYDTIDKETVWETACYHVKTLLDYCEEILETK